MTMSPGLAVCFVSPNHLDQSNNVCITKLKSSGLVAFLLNLRNCFMPNFSFSLFSTSSISFSKKDFSDSLNCVCASCFSASPAFHTCLTNSSVKSCSFDSYLYDFLPVSILPSFLFGFLPRRFS